MPTLNDVYQKFGETAEAAQLLETELGSILLLVRGVEDGLIAEPNPERATELCDKVNRHTLGQLIRNLNNTALSLDAMDALLTRGLQERNRLFHSFYRQHNFRRNSDEGRTLMLEDLNAMHSNLLSAYKAVMPFQGIDLDSLVDPIGNLSGPTGHLPI
jgi:hypothetical protein